MCITPMQYFYHNILNILRKIILCYGAKSQVGVVKYSGNKMTKSKDKILNPIEHNSGHKSLSVPCMTLMGGAGR